MEMEELVLGILLEPKSIKIKNCIMETGNVTLIILITPELEPLSLDIEPLLIL